MSRFASFTAASYLVALTALAALPAYADVPTGNCATDARSCAQQQQGFVPLADFNESAKLRNIYTDSPDFSTFLNKLFVGAISLGAILAVLRLSWAGFRYMTSDLPGQKGHAKEIIGDTLLGLFLLLGIWIILYQINPHILDLNVAAPPASSTDTSGVTADEMQRTSSQFGGVPAGTLNANGYNQDQRGNPI